jgi:hypothetical protein
MNLGLYSPCRPHQRHLRPPACGTPGTQTQDKVRKQQKKLVSSTPSRLSTSSPPLHIISSSPFLLSASSPPLLFSSPFYSNSQNLHSLSPSSSVPSPSSSSSAALLPLLPPPSPPSPSSACRPAERPTPVVFMNSMTAGTCSGRSTLDTVTSGAFWSILEHARRNCLHSKRIWELDTNDSPQLHGSGSLLWSAPGSRSEGVRPVYRHQSARVADQLRLLRCSGNVEEGTASGCSATQRSGSCQWVCACIQVLVVRACLQASDRVAPAFASESAASLPTIPTCAGVHMPRIFHPVR